MKWSLIDETIYGNVYNLRNDNLLRKFGTFTDQMAEKYP